MKETNNYILSCKDICKSYRMGAIRLEVLKGVNLSVSRGEFIAIRGASGSGKSTLLHILGALDTPDKGDVFFEGKNLADFSGRKINEFRNKKIGFVFQFYHLLDELTVLENVLLAKMAQTSALGWLVGSDAAKKRAGQLLGELGLSARVSHQAFSAFRRRKTEGRHRQGADE